MTVYVDARRVNKVVNLYALDTGKRNAAGGVAAADPGQYRLTKSNARAGIEPLSGAERYSDGRVQSEDTHRLVMRSSSVTRALRPRDALTHKTRDDVVQWYDLTSAFDTDLDGRFVTARAKVRPQPESTP